MTQMASAANPRHRTPFAVCHTVGVSVHRTDCTNPERNGRQKHSERLIDVEWGLQAAGGSVFPVDVAIGRRKTARVCCATSEVFTKEKMNVTGVQTQSIKGVAWMTFTVEVSDSGRLPGARAGG